MVGISLPGILAETGVGALTFHTLKIQSYFFGKHMTHSKFELGWEGTAGGCGVGDRVI